MNHCWDSTRSKSWTQTTKPWVMTFLTPIATVVVKTKSIPKGCWSHSYSLPLSKNLHQELRKATLEWCVIMLNSDSSYTHNPLSSHPPLTHTPTHTHTHTHTHPHPHTHTPHTPTCCITFSVYLCCLYFCCRPTARDLIHSEMFQDQRACQMLPKYSLTLFKYPGLRCEDLELPDITENGVIGKHYGCDDCNLKASSTVSCYLFNHKSFYIVTSTVLYRQTHTSLC